MFCLEDAKKLQVLFLFMCSLSLENVKKMFVLSVFSSCVPFGRCQEDAGTCELPQGPAAPESPLELLRSKVRGEEL